MIIATKLQGLGCNFGCICFFPHFSCERQWCIGMPLHCPEEEEGAIKCHMQRAGSAQGAIYEEECLHARLQQYSVFNVVGTTGLV